MSVFSVINKGRGVSIAFYMKYIQDLDPDLDLQQNLADINISSKSASVIHKLFHSNNFYSYITNVIATQMKAPLPQATKKMNSMTWTSRCWGGPFHPPPLTRHPWACTCTASGTPGTPGTRAPRPWRPTTNAFPTAATAC